MVGNINVDAYLATFFVVLFPFCLLIIFYYAEKGTSWHTYPTVFACYYAAFGIIVLIPIDIAMVIVNRRVESDTDYLLDKSKLKPAYLTFFLTLTILASIVLIIQEGYNSDGIRLNINVNYYFLFLTT